MPFFNTFKSHRKPKGLLRLQLLSLEDRIVPATRTWDNGGVTNNWNEAANWDTNTLPVNGDTVILPGNFVYTQNIVGLVLGELRFTNTGVANLTLTTPLGINGSVSSNNITNNSGTNTISGSSIVLSGATCFMSINGGSLTIASPISGNQGVDKRGTFPLTFTMTSSNTYTGTTIIREGTLNLNTNTADSGLSSTIIVGDGTRAADAAILQFGANNFEIPDGATLTINGDGRVNVPAGTTEDLATLNVNGGQLNIAATGIFEIQPNGTVTSNGAAGSVIDGTGNLRSQSGSITFAIADGAGATDLLVSSPLTEGSVSNLIKSGAGTLEFAMQSANALTGTTAINDGVLLLNTNTSDAGLAGTITVGDNTGGASSAVLRIVNAFEIADAATINVNADGLVDVTGTEDITTLNLGSATGGGNMAIATGGSFRIRSAGTVNSIASPTSSTISGGGTFGLLATITFNVANGAAVQDLVINPIISGVGLGIIKAGAGRLTFNANNTYSGTTTVSSGVLEVNGIQSGSAVAVAGGTLGGDGTVGAITATTGIVSPGLTTATSPISLSSGNVTLNGATFSPVISGTVGGAADQLDVTGTVNLTGATLNVIRTGAAVPAGKTFVIINNDSSDAVIGTFTGLAQGATVTVNGQNFVINYTGGTGNDVVLELPSVYNNLLGAKEFGAGADAGSGSVTLFNPNGSVRFTTTPFGAFTGGIRTAAADFTGDGIADLVVGTGPGRATSVRIFDGVTQTEVFTIDPFEPAFTGGIFVAVGDINGDGTPELVITPDQGGGPRVRVFNGKGFTQVADFFGIDDPDFRGGARAAISDLNADGKADLLVAAGFGGGPRLALYDGSKLASTGGPKFLGDFFVFEQTLRNGVFLAAGDVNGDGFADVMVGGGPGGGPRVFGLSGKDLTTSGKQTQVANFFAGDVNARGGIRLTMKDLDNDGFSDIVVGSGTGSGSRVIGYRGITVPVNGTPTPEAFGFDAFAGFTGGVFVG